jgi:prepilin-type N-terminal cleavage/methylation domain-containing protein
MNKEKVMNKLKQGFSLIELMIVIVIIGALTAIILPQFNASESEAKDAGCDASNYGTLRQLSNYRSINGVYPSRLHTGFELATAANDESMGATAGVSALADVTAANLTTNTVIHPLSAGQADSLNAAGIDVLAAGGFGMNAVFTSVTNTVAVRNINAQWLEDPTDPTSVVTINGLPIFAHAYGDPQLDYIPNASYSTSLAGDNLIVPLFVAPTADWDNAVVDGSKLESKISVAQVGGCPWLEGGEHFRYYITYFKVFGDGSPAKLIGTTCPECGSLNP